MFKKKTVTETKDIYIWDDGKIIDNALTGWTGKFPWFGFLFGLVLVGVLMSGLFS